MAGRFTLGIEEEFQLVDRRTLHLRSSIKSVLEKGAPYFEEKIKPELTQSTVELISDICPDIATARKELYTMNYLRALMVSPNGTGADRQVAVYEQTGDLKKVVELLMEQTMQGITLDAADLSHEFLKFKMFDKHAGSVQD